MKKYSKLRYRLFYKVQDEENKIFFPDLNSIMNTWIMQSGHPIVHIKIFNETTILLRQERFFFEKNLLLPKKPV